MLVRVTVIAVKVVVSLLLRESVSTRRLSVGALLLGCVGGLVASPAQAEENTTDPDDAALSCSAPPGDAPTARGGPDVAALFGEFQCWLARGQYEAALVALDQACSASDDPACLFNRGLTHHAQLQRADAMEVQHCTESRRNYAGYVDLSPYDVPAERARRALLEIDQICGPLKVASAPALLPTDPEVIPAWQGEVPLFSASPTHAPENVARPTEPGEVQPVSNHTTTWLLLGAGAASAVAAIVAGVHTKHAWDDLRAHDVPPDQLDALGVTRRSEINVYPDSETKSLERRLNQYEVLTWGFGATAAVLLGVGIGRAVLDAGAAPSLAIVAAPGFGGLSYGGEL